MLYSVIDLFAGPGGLGEGFSTYQKGSRFKIVLSAEMDTAAHKTLLLRSYFRNANFEGDKKALEQYYDWCNNPSCPSPLDSDSPILRKASEEAIKVTLGTPEGNLTVDAALKKLNLIGSKTVLIGGPPCQAYSLVGRARNRGKQNYKPEKDGRHFLYKEYLRIVDKIKPAVFVLENVKGILSSTIQGDGIFQQILNDLSAPGRALDGNPDLEYRIYPLTYHGDEIELFDMESIIPSDYLIHAENYGIPQARHRVILLGIRNDLSFDHTNILPMKKSPMVTLEEVLYDLPPLRSKISTNDSPSEWKQTISDGTKELIQSAHTSNIHEIESKLRTSLKQIDENLDTGSLRYHRDRRYKPKKLAWWYQDDKLLVHLNHESRSHMKSDLIRYFYASVFAQTFNRSPKGAEDFSLKGLRPNHKNWESGKFSDRFKVQLPNIPSTTITSHISKDGHYFIHHDPSQCRSLTVREAARLQTFPDNYFFQGNRTEQYHQVGNAVPPYLAYQIAEIVSEIFSANSE